MADAIVKHDWKESADKKKPPFIRCLICGHMWWPGQDIPKQPCVAVKRVK